MRRGESNLDGNKISDWVGGWCESGIRESGPSLEERAWCWLRWGGGEVIVVGHEAGPGLRESARRQVFFIYLMKFPI